VTLTAAIAIAEVVLVVLSAFFSGSETMLFSLTGAQRASIRGRSQKEDDAISRCMEDSAMLLSTLLVGNTFVNFAIATLGYMLFARLLPGWGGVLAVPVMTFFLLVFGEVMPKQISLRYAENLAGKCARLMLFWKWLLTPFNIAFRLFSQAFSGALEKERQALSDGELVSVLESSAEKGDIVQADVDMIEGVLRLSEIHANDEMTPRVDFEGYDIDLDEEARRVALANARHSHLPVFRRTPDAIEGVIDSKTGEMSDALFVPEQVTLDDLLVTFRKSKKPLAIVLDEYGGTAGLITINDILELVLGPGVFGASQDEPQILKESRNTYVIDARASLDEINRELDIELEAEDADRLSGWVQFHAERIPHVGQQIEADGCRATILKRRKRRVTQVRLEILSRPETDSDEELIAETDEAVERTEEHG
ncbi:MAG: HlyC/CorC family transporter, partial [Kiritimatiellae bacterium]|nr:HlyC/CorC family transporter [Kiritimatiellia bacterium]